MPPLHYKPCNNTFLLHTGITVTMVLIVTRMYKYGVIFEQRKCSYAYTNQEMICYLCPSLQTLFLQTKMWRPSCWIYLPSGCQSVIQMVTVFCLMVTFWINMRLTPPSANKRLFVTSQKIFLLLFFNIFPSVCVTYCLIVKYEITFIFRTVYAFFTI